MSPDSSPPRAFVLLIPVWNDWESLRLLLDDIDAHWPAARGTAHVLVVDDGSTARLPVDWADPCYPNLAGVDILYLRRNLGHQRAIAVGLSHIESHLPCDGILIMDGDGEDSPRYLGPLLAKFAEEGGKKVVFAQRARRSEGPVFALFYWIFRTVHWALTGLKVQFGNFSVLPYAGLRALVVVPALWNHYAASVVRSRLPYTLVPTERAQRYHGASKMNFVSLVTHGLSAISVFGEVVGIRLLIANLVIVIAILLGLLVTVLIRLATDLAIPGWASYVSGIMVVMLFQMVSMSILTVFTILHRRNAMPFLPIRDFVFFIDRKLTLFVHGP